MVSQNIFYYTHPSSSDKTIKCICDEIKCSGWHKHWDIATGYYWSSEDKLGGSPASWLRWNHQKRNQGQGGGTTVLNFAVAAWKLPQTHTNEYGYVLRKLSTNIGGEWVRFALGVIVCESLKKTREWLKSLWKNTQHINQKEMQSKTSVRH